LRSALPGASGIRTRPATEIARSPDEVRLRGLSQAAAAGFVV